MILDPDDSSYSAMARSVPQNPTAWVRNSQLFLEKSPLQKVEEIFLNKFPPIVPQGSLVHFRGPASNALLQPISLSTGYVTEVAKKVDVLKKPS